MDYGKIQYGLTDDVAVVRLDDPKVLNAMSVEMAAELLDALVRGGQDARAILITSAGRAFCAGADLGEGGMDIAGPDRDMGADLDTVFNPLMRQIRRSSVPIVTAVRGAAAGVGCSIALAGDMIVAGEGAFFVQAFRSIGLVPDAGSTFLLTRAIGRPRALEMMLLGERLAARTALEWGLINRVVEDDRAEDEGLALAHKLARGPKSLGIIRRMAWDTLGADFESTLAIERVAQREAGLTEDFVEGVRAFREKREADFHGQ